MADMITRCPKCDTAFRITPAHLRSAKGSVRCGSCLQVFNAKEHLTPGSALEADMTVSKSEPERTTKPAPRPAPKISIPDDPDDILISDDMDSDLNAGDDYSPEPEVPTSSLFEHFPTDNKDGDEDDDIPDDESWALKLLDDDEPVEIVKPSARTTTNHPARDLSADRQAPHNEELFDANDHNDNDYESDNDDLIVHIDPEEGNEEDNEEVEDSGVWPQTEEEDALQPLKDDDDADYFEPAPLTASRRETVGHSYLDAIEPEPVEFSVRSERPFLGSRALWTGLSALALVALIGQIAWWQYPELNRIEPYRSFYDIACDYLGCRLPPQEDISAIRASNLVVRSHPRQANALMVDVILQNTAPFAQEFPNLKLTFSNLQSELVAQRLFTPSEYLGGELAGQPTMPVKQPIHIALEIVDPGAEAVNYQIEVIGR